MDESIEKKTIHKKIMAAQDDYVDNDMFDPDEAIAAALDKRKFQNLLKPLLEDQERFPISDQWIEKLWKTLQKQTYVICWNNKYFEAL